MSVCPCVTPPCGVPTPAVPPPWYPAAWIARRVAAGHTPCSPLTNVPLRHLDLESNLVVRRLTAGLAAAGVQFD